MLKIFSWNVNGIRAVLRKGALQKFLEEQHPDILCLQEIKAKPEQVDYDFPGYQVLWNPARRAGYSGTAILFSKEIPSSLFSDDLNSLDVIRWSSGKDCSSGNFLGDVRNIHLENSDQDTHSSKNDDDISHPIKIADSEGRILVCDCKDFYLVDVYTPNSKPDLSRLKLREQKWDPYFLNLLQELEKDKPVITCGDFNAAHEEIDIARPKTNHHSAGFTDEERQGITNLIDAGFIDTFRKLHPEAIRYTWWSHWGKARERNVGWRIDYFFISKSLKKNLKSAEIYEDYMGSDHCPISIEMDF